VHTAASVGGARPHLKNKPGKENKPDFLLTSMLNDVPSLPIIA
jgi:hypothetical protein